MIGNEMLDRLVEQNPQNHMIWALLDPAREFPGLGGASCWRNPNDPLEAEVSIMVLNDHQRRGIGTLLLAAMWVSAFRAGVKNIVAYTLLENRQPPFPRLRSGQPLFQRPQPKKQIPSI